MGPARERSSHRPTSTPPHGRHARGYERAAADRPLEEALVHELRVDLLGHAARDAIVATDRAARGQLLPGRQRSVQHGPTQRAVEITPAHALGLDWGQQRPARLAHGSPPIMVWSKDAFRLWRPDPSISTMGRHS